ncbi:MAG: hypothetical protein AAF291_06655 [Pseudomonadota bacterium]
MTRKTPAPSTRAALAVSLLASLSLAAAPALAQDSQDGDLSSEQTEAEETKLTKGEKRLAKLLEGRVAGEPQNCIRNTPNERMTTIDKTAYVFGRGNTIFVQRTAKPNGIDDRDTLVLRRFGGGAQLCRQDIATTIDPFTQFFTGAVLFEDFVPYTRESDEEG